MLQCSTSTQASPTYDNYLVNKIESNRIKKIITRRTRRTSERNITNRYRWMYLCCFHNMLSRTLPSLDWSPFFKKIRFSENQSFKQIYFFTQLVLRQAIGTLKSICATPPETTSLQSIIKQAKRNQKKSVFLPDRSTTRRNCSNVSRHNKSSRPKYLFINKMNKTVLNKYRTKTYSPTDTLSRCSSSVTRNRAKVRGDLHCRN